LEFQELPRKPKNKNKKNQKIEEIIIPFVIRAKSNFQELKAIEKEESTKRKETFSQDRGAEQCGLLIEQVAWRIRTETTGLCNIYIYIYKGRGSLAVD
jgi:hypothetical protein